MAGRKSTRRSPRRQQKKIGKKRRRASARHRSTVAGTITVGVGGRVVMVLPRRLKSPNSIKTHWAYRNDRAGWQKEVESAVYSDVGGHRVSIAVMIADGIRMRLDVLRLAPSRRYLLDKDNADFCAKRLQDFLRQAQYFVDDNRMWLDGPYVTQGLSHDKCYWTVVTLTPEAPRGKLGLPGGITQLVNAQAEAKRLLLGFCA